MRTILIGWLAAGVLGYGAGRAAAADEARAVIEQAIRAAGGADKLAQLHAVRTKFKGTVTLGENRLKVAVDRVVLLPDKQRSDIEVESDNGKITVVRVANGGQGWSVVNGQTQDLKDRQLDEMKATVFQCHVESLLPLLKDKALRLAPLGELKVNGRPAVGVKVTAKDRPDVDLYFDQESHRLVKSARRGLAVDEKEVAVENLYGDYKETDGVWLPRTWKITHDGRPFLEAEITEVKFLTEAEAGEFGRP